MRYQKLFALLALCCTSGCATVMEGRTQAIAVDTMPEGATCTLMANDELLGIIQSTPGSVDVNKSKYDIVVQCTKEGYIKSKIKDHSDMAASSLVNYAMLSYSFIGSAIDNATGAANKYDSHMLITLDEDKDYKAAQLAKAATQAAPAPAALTAAAIVPVAAPAPAPLKPAGKYSTVENLATKKPEPLPPALPSEMAVPYIDVASASLGKPLPALAPAPQQVATQAAAPPAAVPAAPVSSTAVVAAATPTAPIAAPQVADKVPAFVKAIPQPTGKVTHMPSAAEMQVAQLSDAECAMTQSASPPSDPW